jgi:redox-sensing transcriptional repressor
MAQRSPNDIPDIVIGRLPIYLRALRHMVQEGLIVTSSHELGQRLGISPAQIRKDLSHFGGFGKQGTGYQIAFLEEKLSQVLKVNKTWEVALVGAGDLGTAIAHYRGFKHRGFHIGCIFDNAPEKVGTELGALTVQPMDKLHDTIHQRGVQVAMIAVPADQAQDVATQLIKAGVSALLNYAPISLTVPAGIHVQYIDPVVHLQHMTYYLK